MKPICHLWVYKNGLAKNWREVHPHASNLLTIIEYNNKPPLLYLFHIFLLFTVLLESDRF